ncbi:TPR-like protein, partial [Neoconidiobolus thromboides FSU 785]
KFLIQSLGISLLSLFIQIGWTGPDSKLDIMTLLPLELTSGNSSLLNKTILDKLSVDGEEAYHLTPKPVLLWLALILFDTLINDDDDGDLVTLYWWSSRCHWIRERILDNPTGSTLEKLEVQMNKALTTLPSFGLEDVSDSENCLSTQQVQELRARYYVELGLYHHHFYNEKNAVEQYTKAQECTGLKWKLTGALGKRTKFQQNDITQLVLWAKSRPDENDEHEVDTKSNHDSSQIVPETLDLNDDTLLEKVKFSEVASKGDEDEVDVTNQTTLKIIDQCILLALCINVKNSNPVTGLTREEMFPYVTRVLENPINWMVHTMGLILRSRLEGFKSRTIERSVFQLQALVDQFNDRDGHVTERMLGFYSILIPSKWELEKELAEKFMSLGVIKSALEIYEKLEMYEQIIECYKLLEQPEKAIKVVDHQLEINPNSAKMLCLKGDVLNEPEWWYKSWEVSNNRFSRAMRALGAHYYGKNEFGKSRDCYLNALKINPLFENSWFICGCASMHIDDWDSAQKCFQKVTSIDPDNGEAWNNLATIYIRKGKKSEALISLQQALKHSPGNWKMWTNLQYTAVDLGHFNLVMRAIKRILDLRWETVKDQCIDREVLSIVINSVQTDIEDGSGNGSSRHANQLETLLDDITSKVAGNNEIWLLKAKFYTLGPKHDPSKALDSHIKAYRCVLNHPDLLTSHDIFSLCSTTAIDLVDAYSNFGPLDNPNSPGEIVCKDWKFQSKMLLKSLISRTSDSYETEPEHDMLIKSLKEL